MFRYRYYFHLQLNRILKKAYSDRLEMILTMVYVVQNSQNFSGLFPSSCIPKNTTFQKLDLFQSSGEGGGEDTYSAGCLRERSSFRNVVFFGIQDDGKSLGKFCEFCKAYSVGPSSKATFKLWFGTDSTKGLSEIEFASFLLVGYLMMLWIYTSTPPYVFMA
jgi:hypothetical protein